MTQKISNLLFQQKNKGRHLMLCFILIFSSVFLKAQSNNLALYKPVTASTLLNALTLPASNLTDGDLNNYTSCNNTATGSNADWFMIDLGNDFIIQTLRITARAGYRNRARRFMILTSSSSLGPPPTYNPASYLTDSRFNRLIYTSPTSGSTFGIDGVTVPGPANTLLGPDFTTLTLDVGVHIARYIFLFDLQDDIFDLAEIEVIEGPPATRSFNNGSFETGIILAANSFGFPREGLVPGWSTTEAVGMSDAYGLNGVPTNGSSLELWRAPFGSVQAFTGNYFAELNAFTNAELSQNPICVGPGENFDFSFAHRGRNGVDVMRLRIDNVDVAQFSDNNSQAGTHTGTVLTPATTTLSSVHPTNANGWTQYSGTWTNSSSSSKIVTFAYRAVSSAGGALGIGNFLDAVTLTSLSCIASLSTNTASGTETMPTANLPAIVLNGNLSTAETIQVALSGTATLGSDYTSSSGTAVLTINIPAGNYIDSAISLSGYIQVLNDAIPAEPNETIILTLQNSTGNLLIADTNACGLNFPGSIYTILDQPSITISGKVFDDANGITDATINGTGTNAGGLYAILIEDDHVIASATVGSSGTYSFTNITPGLSYTVLINQTSVSPGGSVPLVTLPNNWVAMGENNGSGTGYDSTVNSISAIFIPTANVGDINFGIEQRPVANGNYSLPAQPQANTNSLCTVPPTAFGGTDPDGTVTSILITEFPSNTTSITIGTTVYYLNSAAIPAGCNDCVAFPPAGIQLSAPGGQPLMPIAVNPAGNTATTVVIPYMVIDNGELVSNNLGTVTIPFTTPLPVSWMSFGAEVRGMDTDLEWVTITDKHSNEFTIEYSTDGIVFLAAGTVKAIANNLSSQTYNYTHEEAGKMGRQILCYRIRQTDVDGQFTFSQTKCVRFNTTREQIQIYPNPVKKGEPLYISGKNINSVEIISTIGKCVWAQVYSNASEAALPTHMLASGTYFLWINGQQQATKIQVR